MRKMTDITKEELLKLYDMDLDELIEMSSKITKENFKNELEVCSIISARTGKCSENCKYCSQSIHNHADIVCHPLLSVEEVQKDKEMFESIDLEFSKD